MKWKKCWWYFFPEKCVSITTTNSGYIDWIWMEMDGVPDTGRRTGKYLKWLPSGRSSVFFSSFFVIVIFPFFNEMKSQPKSQSTWQTFLPSFPQSTCCWLIPIDAITREVNTPAAYQLKSTCYTVRNF